MANMEKTVIRHPSDAICSDHIVGGGHYCQEETSSQESTVFVCNTDYHAQLQITNDAGQSSTAAVRKEEEIYCPQPEGPGDEQLIMKCHVQESSRVSTAQLWELSNTITFHSVGVFHPYKFIKVVVGLLILVLYPKFAATDTVGPDCNNLLSKEVVEGQDSRSVHLSCMGLQGFEADACFFSSEMETLSMSDNCLSNLPLYCFKNNTKLHGLDLSSNSFSSVRPITKSMPQNLQHLNMNTNPVFYLARNDFEGMNQLTVIRFADCQIESIHPEALNASPALVQADFPRNNLSIIPYVNLTYMINLRLMDVCKNSLETLNIVSFGVSQGVRNISVSDDEMMVQMANSSVKFLISGNYGTLKCEEIRTEIINSNVAIKCNLSCVFENGTAGRIEFDTTANDFAPSVTPRDHDFSTSPLGKYSPTPVTPGGHDLARHFLSVTPGDHNLSTPSTGKYPSTPVTPAGGLDQSRYSPISPPCNYTPLIVICVVLGVLLFFFFCCYSWFFDMYIERKRK